MPFRCVRCHAEIERTFKACPHCGEPVTDFLRRYLDEPVDGKYRIIERLGAGGMGEVYKVEHVFLRAIRVIKVIRPSISEDADAHERFLREAQLATKVQHPNVATLHDFSALPDGSHYMVWEFIEGENLAQVIRKRGVIAPAYAIRLAIQALNGLDAIHRAGIIHRDISPENLMITSGEQPDERVKLIDLGVAKMDEGDYAATRTGIFVGKLRYSSPEQLGFLNPGEKIDGRADLYSLAIVVYEMLTGRPPFEATSPHQYILHHSQDTKVQSLDLTRIPAPLQPVLARALERDRTKRYATAREFADAFESVAPMLPSTDSDSTLRLTPPAGTTIRHPATVRTESVQKPPVRTVVEKPRRQTGLLLIIVLLVLAFGALATWHFRSQPAAVATNIPKTAAAQSVATPQPTTTTV
ncbi:MAG TPA: serine/threonine-protein kinase, partial [Thermoanaerobaculia bacterium]